MKGSGNNLIYLFTLILLATISVAFFFGVLDFKGEKTESLLIKRDIHVLRNALEGARIYGEQGLLFSFYQGCFDFLRRGGYSEIPGARVYQKDGISYALWYDNGYQSPTLQDVFNELGKEVGRDMKFYTSNPFRNEPISFKYISVDGNPLEVFIPADYAVSLKEAEAGKIQINAISLQKMSVSKSAAQGEQKTTILADSALEREVRNSCVDVLKKGREKSSAFGAAAEKNIIEEVNKWAKSPPPVTIERALFESEKNNRALGNIVLSSKYGKTIDQIEAEIKGNIQQRLSALLPATEGGYSFGMDTLDFRVTIEPDCSSDSKEGKTVVACTKILYTVFLVTKITLTDTQEDHKMPVWNGQDVALSFPQLVFAERVSLALDKNIEILGIDGTYKLSIVWDNHLVNEGLPIFVGLQQQRETIQWAVAHGAETLTGTSVAMAEGVKIKDVVVNIVGPDRVLGPYLLTFDTRLSGSGISGTVSGISPTNNDLIVRGTFTGERTAG